MSEKYKVLNPEGTYFITCTIVDWVDLLSRAEYKDIIIDSLKFCQLHKGLIVHAYVIMSNHIHLIASTEDGVRLQDVIRDFKKFTSKRFIEEMNTIHESRKVWLLKKFSFAANRIINGVNYKVWQDGFHPIELDSSDKLEQKLAYIHDNPVSAGIVYEAEDYVYSSASVYAGNSIGMSVELVL